MNGNSGGITNCCIPIFNTEFVEQKQFMDIAIKDCDKAFNNPISSRANYSELLEKFSSNAYFLCAYKESCIAYIAFYANKSDTAYISLIAVNPRCQKQGVGSFLINACERIVKDKGMSKIKLEVKKENKSAIDFYKNKGFKLLTDCTDNSYFMQKNCDYGEYL